MDDNRAPFVAKCSHYGLSEPNVVPPYVDLNELKRDLDLFNNLQSIAREINRLADMVNDTHALPLVSMLVHWYRSIPTTR